MTDSDLLLLQRGRIPADLITPHIQKYLDAEGLENDNFGPKGPGPLYLLAERAGVQHQTLYAYVAGKRRSMDFDSADRILVAVGRVDLWRGELIEFYEAVNLEYRQPTPRDKNSCRNGHARTPENMKTRADGRSECRLCAREAGRRTYKQRTSQAA